MVYLTLGTAAWNKTLLVAATLIDTIDMTITITLGAGETCSGRGTNDKRYSDNNGTAISKLPNKKTIK